MGLGLSGSTGPHTLGDRSQRWNLSSCFQCALQVPSRVPLPPGLHPLILQCRQIPVPRLHCLHETLMSSAAPWDISFSHEHLHTVLVRFLSPLMRHTKRNSRKEQKQRSRGCCLQACSPWRDGLPSYTVWDYMSRGGTDPVSCVLPC